MKRFMNILVEENIVMEAAIAAALLPGDRPEIVEAAVEIEQKRDKRKELFQERARQFLQEFEGPTT